MAKKKDFDDPLADIDPIMEEAFSVNEDSKNESAKPKKRRGRPKKKVEELVIEETEPGQDFVSDMDEENDLMSSDVTESEDVEFPSIETEDSEGATDIYSEDLTQKPIIPEPLISGVQFPDIEMEQSEDKMNSGIFSNIPVDVAVELGRSHVSLKEVFELTEGSIIELERLVGEPLDLVVNGQVVAQGEVVAIDNNYGLRVTNVISSVKR
ncbi:flagellar motor switch protein FliN [Candidatus Marinamargulisbacteria bacterium SCGC AAA071-K20]|nr:flagellar motor switch protein FliN [Candidatus Marinamargulisbacteria bacterium SCGC AAA071-K20]